MRLNANGKTSGSRTDWSDVLRMIKVNEPTGAILEKHPAMIPNTRAIQHVRFVFQCERSREEATKLLVLWGHPDTGKTTTAISLCEEGRYFVLTADGKSVWWDGYDPDRHETIILDEFVGSRMPLTFLNQLCDTLDINVQTKGGFTRFLAKRVIITSNFSPREWYAATAESRQESLWRRISTEVEFRLEDEVIDMHGDPSKTHKRLRLIVHKGVWNWAFVKSRYPFCAADAVTHSKHAMRLADEPVEPPSPIPERDLQRSASDAYVARRVLDYAEFAKRRRGRSWQLGDSQDEPIELSCSEELEEDEDADPAEYDDYEEWEAAQAERRRPHFMDSDGGADDE